MKTDRMTLLVTPKEKRAIASRARRAGLSASEYVRRAVDAYDPDRIAEAEVPEDVMELLKELVRVTERTEKSLDRALARADAFEAYMAREGERREEIRKELLRTGERWPFPLPGASGVEDMA